MPHPSAAPTHLRIETFVGNTIYRTLEVRRYGQKTPENLSGASGISLEWEDGTGQHQTPINVVDTLPGADWAAGLVVLPFTPSDFTAAEGTYTFSVTVTIDGQVETYATGVCEVKERPGYPAP